MRRKALATALLLALGASRTMGAEVTVGDRVFRLPDGFTVEKVAGLPLVDRPIMGDFDELGRLYVADSSGTNDNVKKQLVDLPHRIIRLEDVDGDGKYDRSTVFADKMMFPAGTMWLDGSLYVAAPPSIWKLTDIDGDGVADLRQEWFQGKTLTGCANDLHGPYAGLDGRVYWTKGAFAAQTYERPGRSPLQTRAAHILRAKVDGSGIEPVMTGGMDNPVDVVFTPGGERIFTTTFLQTPGGGLRDGLIHALYGGVYGKLNGVLEGHPRTRLEMLPTLVHLGPAAPSGLLRAESDVLGSRDALFATCFNLRKVTRHILTPKGGSFEASTEDFLATDDLDFHATDVQEDADGSLLVVDTGGWYKLCCPSSQVVKPDVLGAIYRVRRQGALKVDDPRGLKLAWSSMTPAGLTGLLDDSRPAVRRRAIANLAKLGAGASIEVAKAVKEGRSAEARRNALWAACRVDSPEGRATVRTGLEDLEPTVRQVAAHASGLWRDREATPRLIENLRDNDPGVVRASAEALGRLGEPSAIPGLLRAAGESPDWAVQHSLTFALIEIDDPATTRPGLDRPTPGSIRAAMVAIDQMEGGSPKPEPVLGALTATDQGLRDAAWWIAGRHPEWGDSLAGFFRSRFGNLSLAPGDLADLEARLASMCGAEPIRALIAGELANNRNPLAVRLALLRSMGRAGLKETPEGWVDALARALDDPALIGQAVATARAIPIRPERSRGLAPALLQVAGREDQPVELRLGALAALPGGLAKVEPGSLGLLLGQLAPDRPVSSRTTAADVLSKAKLEPDQYAKLAGSLAQAGPLEAGRLLDAFDKAQGEEIGRRLVEALQRSPARSSLNVEALKPRLAHFGPNVVQEAESLYAAIEADSADRRTHLEGILANLSGGDVRRGQLVFNGSKAACASCHAIGYRGGKLGPDLTKIGQIRAERDLLESIVYPSASFVRSYEPISIATKDGRTFSGVLRKDAPDELILSIAADKDERIARDQVEEMAPGTVSVMPAGLDRQLSAAELVDLIAFLKACR